MVSELPTGFLTLRTGTFGRTTRATSEGAIRAIDISACPVSGWRVMSVPISDKLDGHSFRVDEELQVYITEAKGGFALWAENPEKIGALNADHMNANLFLPPDAFASFWSAAESADSSKLSMEIVLKPDHRDTLSVTNVGLFEHGAPIHPVVAELRLMREQLSGLTRSIVIALYVFAAVWVLLRIFR